MTPFDTRIQVHSPEYELQRSGMLALVEQLQALEQRAMHKSAQAKATFSKRGALLPRERLARLLDPLAPFLPLCNLAGYGMDSDDLEAAIFEGATIVRVGTALFGPRG